jgi:hypothetical protein
VPFARITRECRGEEDRQNQAVQRCRSINHRSPCLPHGESEGQTVSMPYHG